MREEGMEEKKKSSGRTLSFYNIITTLKILFGRKKLLDAKGPFGNNVIKNSVRYTFG